VLEIKQRDRPQARVNVLKCVWSRGCDDPNAPAAERYRTDIRKRV
jgi:hypothetical protein